MTVANHPTTSAKNVTGDFDRFKAFARRVVRVPHSQIKAQLEAEKEAKRARPKGPSSRASVSPTKQAN
jgi:hypothetical protein